MSYRGYNFDALLEMKDAGAIVADAAAQVAGVDRVLDLGAARWEGVVVINTTALDLADTNETYDVQIQLSNSATFASGNEIFCKVPITALGRVEVPFVNQKYGTGYRYARLFTDVGGTTPSINYTAYASTLKWA
jgi:hypothetical protein